MNRLEFITFYKELLSYKGLNEMIFDMSDMRSFDNTVNIKNELITNKFYNFIIQTNNIKKSEISDDDFTELIEFTQEETAYLNELGCNFKRNDIIDINIFEMIDLYKLIVVFNAMLVGLSELKTRINKRLTFCNFRSAAITGQLKFKTLSITDELLNKKLKTIDKYDRYYNSYITVINNKSNILKECAKQCYELYSSKSKIQFSVRLKELLKEKQNQFNNFDIASNARQYIINWLQIKDGTFCDYLKERSLPDTIKLTQLSSIFDVDLKYLLGTSDLRNDDIEINTALAALGFSTASINKLKNLNNDEKYMITQILNLLLSEENMSILTNLYDFFYRVIGRKKHSFNLLDLEELKHNIINIIYVNTGLKIIKADSHKNSHATQKI